MMLAEFGRCFSRHKGSICHEPTIAELLSDPIVKAVMKADGVDPSALEAQLARIAQTAATFD
jgi:hypothetical protein